MKKTLLLLLFILITGIVFAQKGKTKKDDGGNSGSGSGSSSGTTETTSALETIKLNPAVELTISYSTTPKFTFNTLNDYESGLTLTGISTVTIKSTGTWTLTVKSSTANFTKSASSTTNMPSTVLSLGTSQSSTFQTISTSPITLATGTKGTNTKTGNFFTLNYKANPGFNYDGGTYSIDLLYTLTAQ